MKIILDTNILVYAAKQKIDLIDQIRKKFGQTAEIIVPNLVVKELEKLSEEAKRGADKHAAKLAIQIVKFSKVKNIKLEGNTDRAIVQWAKKNKAAVATHDRELKKTLRDIGLTVFQLRQGKALKTL